MFALLAAAAMSAAVRLSDEQLLAKAKAVTQAKDDQLPSDPVLGEYHGTKVTVTSRCGDICPAYTVRIVHYDLPAGAPCYAIGGKLAKVPVPLGIAMQVQDFCIPPVLYPTPYFVGHPYQNTAH